ncbi:hypothetical protein VCCP1035_1879A, partial [Vibrio cholerae CP1035(8)]
MTTTS